MTHNWKRIGRETLDELHCCLPDMKYPKTPFEIQMRQEDIQALATALQIAYERGKMEEEQCHT